MLLRHLPPESAYGTALRESLTDEQLDELSAAADGKHGPWSHTDHLLAAVVDSLERLAWIQVARAGVKNHAMPQPVSRPGLHRSPTKPVDDRATAYLEAIRQRHRDEAVDDG